MIAVSWSNLTDAGAFLVGFFVATVSILWILRMVLRLFEADPHFRHKLPSLRKRPPEDDESGDP